MGRWGRGAKNSENFVKIFARFRPGKPPKTRNPAPGPPRLDSWRFSAPGVLRRAPGAPGSVVSRPAPAPGSFLCFFASRPGAGLIFSASISRIPGVSGFGRLLSGSRMPYCCEKPRREPGRPEVACLPSKKCEILLEKVGKPRFCHDFLRTFSPFRSLLLLRKAESGPVAPGRPCGLARSRGCTKAAASRKPLESARLVGRPEAAAPKSDSRGPQSRPGQPLGGHGEPWGRKY